MIDGSGLDETRLLAPEEAPALEALLSAQEPAATYARSHLRGLGLGPGGVRAWGWPEVGPFGAALVARDGIGWVVWRAPAAQVPLAARLQGLNVQLLSGPPAQVAPVLAAVARGRLDGQDRCPFELLTPATFRPAPGPARRAGPADMERLIDFYSHGFYSLTYLPTRAAWQTRLSEQLAQRTLFVVEQDGRVVAAAQSSAETPDSAMIGGVATLPAYRNRGLSGICVSALCAHLFTGGRRCIGLFYMPGNTAAAHVYARLGFQPAGEWWLTRLAASL
jgi:RimJ/RimL family protein N-acetyltransferase